MLAADHHPDIALELLPTHWQPGDYTLIEARLRDHASDQELHELELSVLNIVDRNQSPAAAAVLLYLYEHGPCSFCRRQVVEHLLELELLADWMRHECCYDANPEIRALVRPG